MERTKHLRIGITSLFVAYVNPYNAFSKSTISRLIKNILGLAGIDMRGFKPHYVRTSSTSAAALAKVLLDTILQTAGWSRHCTFAKYCKKKSKNMRSWQKLKFDGNSIESSRGARDHIPTLTRL